MTLFGASFAPGASFALFVMSPRAGAVLPLDSRDLELEEEKSSKMVKLPSPNGMSRVTLHVTSRVTLLKEDESGSFTGLRVGGCCSGTVCVNEWRRDFRKTQHATGHATVISVSSLFTAYKET